VNAAAGLARLRVGQWFAITLAILGVALLAASLVATYALSRDREARALVVDRVDPALALTEQLRRALVDQQTGIRGYLLSGRETFAAPYDDGLADERRIARRLRSVTAVPELAALRRDLLEVQRSARRWRASYAMPVRAALVARDGRSRPSEEVGKAAFDEVRAGLTRLTGDLTATRGAARDRLEDAAHRVRVVLIAAVAALLGLGLVAALALRVAVTRPLAGLPRTCGAWPAATSPSPWRPAAPATS
jgi:CHASE3 domain sensor protein